MTEPVTDTEHFQCPEGMKVRTTSRDVTVVELDWFCDPAKLADPEFEAKMIRLIGVQRWRREFCRDWNAAAGERYYPEFDPTRNVQRLEKLLDAPVIRGWDFGRRSPACVWLQYSPKSQRAWVLREIAPRDMNIFNLRDLVRFLSGDVIREYLIEHNRLEALQYLDRLAGMEQWDGEPMPAPPWFQPGQTFYDYAGHEAMMSSGLIEKQGEALTCKDVLADGGIQLGAYMTRESSKEIVTRKLLHIQADGMPGLMMDPACKVLIEGFSGGISFAKPSPQNPRPDQRANDGKYEHLDDALGYPLVNLVPVADGGKSTDAEQQRLGVALRGQDFRVDPAKALQSGEGFDSGYLEDQWR